MLVKPPTYKNSTTSPDSRPASSNEERRVINPAAEVGLSRVDFYKTDKWVLGHDGIKGVFVAPKNTLPQPLEKNFVRSVKQNPVGDKIRYDRGKFKITEILSHEEGSKPAWYVEIKSLEMKEQVAFVSFSDAGFVVNLHNKSKTGVFPFSKDDLLKAVNAAKWSLELFCLEDSDSGSEDEAPKKA